ncbi:MAG: sodium-translocating pyrophosphatase [Candidatus Bathyarchaeota archaeon]|nr:sodium-translocating pyrophosphatase [Candidatus Bathyarchaeota archaeon]
MDPLSVPIITVALTGLLLLYIYRFIFSKSVGSPKLVEISGRIEKGTRAYLNSQFKVLIPFLGILAALMFFVLGWRASVSFVVGAAFSIFSAYAVMRLVVRVHPRVAWEARSSGLEAFKTAFLGGGIMGLSVPALCLIGLTAIYAVSRDPNDLVGFGFGASLTALFAQVGGGIYTKAADIGADLVGKVELNIPEDDPRNPAVIADLVGDNVGDCAGRGADLFQSFSGDVITGMILGVAFVPQYGPGAIVFPLLLQCVGNLASLVGVALIKGLRWNPERSIVAGLIVTALLSSIGAFLLVQSLIGDTRIFIATLSGLAAVIISMFTAQHYTGYHGGPVTKIAKASERGAALNIITGLSYGLQSPIIPIAGVIGAAVFSYIISGSSLYAIAIANIGTDLMIGFIMSADAFGPIVDNADGVSEMTGESGAGENLALLDAVGNSMKAYTKALSMTTGTLTAFAVFITFFQVAGVKALNLMVPWNFAALFMGAALSFLVASLTIGSTAKTAGKMVDEIREQCQMTPAIMEGKAEPDYERCINISTNNALREMVWPGLLAVIPPVVTGLLFGAETLVALLIGVTLTSVCLAVFFNNVGAAWDNAKKLIEREFWRKGTEAHKAAVVGDTVGDPMKDVAGPSLIIYMKLVGMTALLLLPLLVERAAG